MIWIWVWCGLAALIGFGLLIVGFVVMKKRGEMASEGWRISGALIMGIALVMGVIFTGVAWGDRITCRNKATAMGLPYHWSLSSACLVKVNGRYYPIEQVQNVGGRIEVAP
jgi:hypothetical protein